MALDQRELATFLAIARLGSIGRASELLSRSQPAISRTLSALEDRFGAKLFVRHSTGMELTAFGEALRPHAELVESEMRRMFEEIDVLRGSAKGLVRVGIVPSVAANLLPKAIRALLERSPDTRVCVVEDTGNRLIAALVRGNIELAIVGLWQEPFDEDVVVTPLFADEVCVMGRWSHPAFSEKNLSLNALQRYRWAMPEKGNVIWSEYRLVFRRAGLEPPPVTVESNSVHTLKSLVATSDFITMLAHETFRIEEKWELLRPLPIAEGRWQRRLGIVRRSGGRLLPAASMLFTELRRVASST
jgi:DNA-binding transcriptional LysR family regulator